VKKIFKYEMKNILRNRWVFAYAVFIGLLTFSLIRIGGDFQKAILSLSGIVVVLIPLVASLFTALYWYYNDRFTELMLTQPLPRQTLYWARYFALSMSLSLCYLVGLVAAFLFYGTMSVSILLLGMVGVFLTFIFVAASLWISISIVDRMRGVGLVFGFWIYFVLIHDAALLMFLLLLKDYPMDLPGGLLGASSPIGLSRVILLMSNEGALLLGHTGALVRNILTSWKGYGLAMGFSILWLIGPLLLGLRAFKKATY